MTVRHPWCRDGGSIDCELIDRAVDDSAILVEVAKIENDLLACFGQVESDLFSAAQTVGPGFDRRSLNQFQSDALPV